MSQSFSEVQNRIDEICLGFEQQWQGGTRPAIEEHLLRAEEPHWL